MQKQKNYAAVFIILVLVIIATLIFMVYDYSNEKSSSSNLQGILYSVKADSASVDVCLKNQEIYLFINEENPVEFLDKMSTTDYLNRIRIKNCYRDIDYCKITGVKTYPSWLIKGKLYEGKLTKDQLIQYSGC